MKCLNIRKQPETVINFNREIQKTKKYKLSLTEGNGDGLWKFMKYSKTNSDIHQILFASIENNNYRLSYPWMMSRTCITTT